MAALDRAREPRPLRLLERGQHRVDQERRARAEQADHELAERLAEAGVGPIGGLEQTPGVAAVGAADRCARRTSNAVASAGPSVRMPTGSSGDGSAPSATSRGPVGAEQPRVRHLGEVVVLGGDPERRHRFAAGALETLGDQRRPGHLGQGVERTAEESRLLAGDDDQRVGIGEALRQLARARVAVRRVGALELGRDLGALARSRLERRQRAGRGEDERREQLVAPAARRSRRPAPRGSDRSADGVREALEEDEVTCAQACRIECGAVAS